MNLIDPTRLALPLANMRRNGGSRQSPRRFLKGPIPWPWLATAAGLPGRALHVAVAIWFLVGVSRSMTVKLSNLLLSALGVDRHAKYRALQQLERAGLVAVSRSHGRNPMVTVYPDAGQE